MTREIKFRAWNGEMMSQPFSPKELNRDLTGLIDQFGVSVWWDGCEHEWMQFTGLHDKNGKEIYEGDIVRWDDCTNGEKWRVALVEIAPSLRFRIISIKCNFKQSAPKGTIFEFGNFIYKDTQNHLEIIGNIYENTELLNK